MARTQTRRMGFRLNQKKVLRDLILHQAGTLEKACVEGVMNGIDAGASTISIEIGERTIRITDDGKGFRSLQEIRDWFGTIGLEHSPDEQKRFGRFRMGRGQMFKYGRNTWRSNTFQMEVDIRSSEWEDPSVEEPPFHVTEGLPTVPGCDITIELYEPLVPSEVMSVSRELARMVKYSDARILINGTAVNKPPTEQKWDIVTNDAYINLRDTGTLVVYNDGIYVMSLPSYRFGTGGEVVSRGVFTGLNYARNDIDSSDPKWKRIRQVIQKHSQEKVRKKPRLADHEREFIAKQVADGTYKGDDIRDLRILYDATGRAWSLNSIVSHLSRNAIPAVTVAPEGDFKADTLMQRNTAFVFSERTLDLFEVGSVKELITLLHKRIRYFHWPEKVKILSYKEATKGLSDTHRIVPDEALTEKERFLLNFLRHTYRRCFGWQDKPRRLVAGESETAHAWTDGATFIAIAREHIRNAENLEGWLYVAELLHHEQTHDDPTTDQHTHTPEFYRAFHDTLIGGFIRRFVGHAVADFPNALKSAGRTITKRYARTLDKLVRAGHLRDEAYARMSELERIEKVAAELKSRKSKPPRAAAGRRTTKPAKTTKAAGSSKAAKTTRRVKPARPTRAAKVAAKSARRRTPTVVEAVTQLSLL